MVDYQMIVFYLQSSRIDVLRLSRHLTSRHVSFIDMLRRAEASILVSLTKKVFSTWPSFWCAYFNIDESNLALIVISTHFLSFISFISSLFLLSSFSHFFLPLEVKHNSAVETEHRVIKLIGLTRSIGNVSANSDHANLQFFKREWQIYEQIHRIKWFLYQEFHHPKISKSMVEHPPN